MPEAADRGPIAWRIPPRFDVLLAIAIAAAGESEVWLTNVPGPRYASASAAAVGGLALAWRRCSPLTITMLVLVVECGQFWLGVRRTRRPRPWWCLSW